MYRRFKTAALAGLLIGFAGLILDVTPFGRCLEENLGLYVLFQIRGPRLVPSNVVIISMDRETSEVLGLPFNPLKWPRNLHATLIDTLAEKKVRAIAYDVLFLEPTDGSDDELLADALERASNVVLCEHLREDRRPVSKEIYPFQNLHAEKLIPPADPLVSSAAALAPFSLPEIPTRVSRYWAFKTEAGCTPTLPVVAFQLYALDALKDFRILLESVSPAHSGILPESAQTVFAGGKIDRLVAKIRELFEDSPWIGKEMLNRLREHFPAEPAKRARLRSLVKLYMVRDSVFLNFYGPPATFPTYSFHRIVNPENPEAFPDLTGKTVFVGLSELTRNDQRDGFNTVFSRSDGMDLSRVEIAATAFANLLEDMPVRPAPQAVFLGICLVWGFAAGCLCFRLNAATAVLIMAAAAMTYTAVAAMRFQEAGTWLPIAVPFAVQAPLALLAGFSWKRGTDGKERRKLRKAFGFFLPDQAVDRIIDDMRDTAGIPGSQQTLFGTVLCSDGAQYASLSEHFTPEELTRFLNRYHETIFQPVIAHGGSVSNVIEDCMLAIWASTRQNSNLKRGACRAAMDIIKAIGDFNRKSHPYHLQTRIGLHHGQLLLGTVGGIDHHEYRPVGDVVITASRLEALNKLLGTRVLASEEAVNGNSDVLARKMGRFVLHGKRNPTVVFELICPVEESLEWQREANAIFSEALKLFECRYWNEAETLFNQYLKLCGDDKLSRFYIHRCETYRREPPGEMWDGIVSLDVK